MVALRESQLLQIADRAVQDKIDGVVECMDSLLRSTQPATTYLQASDFFAKVLERPPAPVVLSLCAKDWRRWQG